MKKVAIIQFPGTNCEDETKRAVEAAGLKAEFFPWNQKPRELKNFQAFILPGGFSYEDRSRAGIIAALDPIMKQLKSEADKGKPILGICNGAQILIESGLIPGITGNNLAGALAINKRIKNNQILGTGFYNNWINIKSIVPKNRTPFTFKLSAKKVLSLPIAHGEGRFIFDSELLKKLFLNQQIIFQYCDNKGKIIDQYPTNPNGAIKAIAGACNPLGNILALMPHPERSPFGHGRELFFSLRDYLNGKFQLKVKEKEITYQIIKPEIKPYKIDDNILQLFVELIITDNEAVSVTQALKLLGYQIRLKKKIFWQIECQKTIDSKKLITQIIKTSELVNLNKEKLQIKLLGKNYFITNKYKFVPLPRVKVIKNSYNLLIFYQDDLLGKSKTTTLKEKLGLSAIIKIKRGVLWELNKVSNLEPILKTNIFYNPFSQICYQYKQ